MTRKKLLFTTFPSKFRSKVRSPDTLQFVDTDTSKAESETFVIAQANAKNVVFSFAQMLAHHTAGGCPMRTGDLIATGTLSGPRPSEYGCLLEVTRDGVESAEFVGSNNQTLKRTFLEDGDNVIFSAHLPGKGGLGAVGFGSCEGRIVASHP